MSNIETGIGGLVVLIGMLGMRVPVGLAMSAVSVVGIAIVAGPPAAYGVLASIPYDFVANWTWSAVPMFLLMGYVCHYSGLTSALFALARAVFGPVRGGVAIATIVACTGFAALTGSSIATAAAMVRIALPEMIDAGYERNFASGVVAAGGTIGALIPPSIIMVVFGVLAETSIRDLFLGGVVIGLLTAVAYSTAVVAVSYLRPELIPPSVGGVDVEVVLSSLREVWPVVLLVVGVLVGLFSGLFTTTEAGAVGAGLATLIGLTQGRLSFKAFTASVSETASICGALLIIGVGATMFTLFLSISGIGTVISDFANERAIGTWEVLLLTSLVYLVLGTFMDGMGALLITLPIFLPMVRGAEVDLVVFGVLVAKLIEIGMITPPFGLNVFVIKSSAGDTVSIGGIFRSIGYFLAADLALLATIIAYPMFASDPSSIP